MSKKKKVAAVALAALMTCGTLAGCDALTTVNIGRDYAQIIAEVDISESEDFAPGGKYAGYDGVVTKAEITKREMVASYVSSGYSLQQQYNWSYAEVFDTIAESLVNRQVFIQYAKVDLALNGDAEGNKYSVKGYLAKRDEAGEDAVEYKREAYGLSHFLTEAEKAKADYDLKVSLNESLDSIEEGIIELEEEEASSSSDVRTLPTGAETEDKEYYTSNYGIYTGREDLSVLGEYERVEGSTSTTRRKAYTRFLGNLRQNDLLQDGEDTSDFTNLTYYWMEVKSAYETAIINKMTDKFEKQALEKLTPEWTEGQFEETLKAHTVSYSRDKATFEAAFDKLGASSFVLAPYNANYGYVINILLPFSELQTQRLEDASNDFGDAKGNKFEARTRLLNAVKATDQRGTWFTGSEDYSFEAGADAYTAGDPDRDRLFFENSFAPKAEEGAAPAKYQRLANYYGKYTYNGKAEKNEDGEYELTPKKIDVNAFLDEMKGYLESVGDLNVSLEKREGYFDTGRNYYYTAEDEAADPSHKAGEVNYDSFVYATGQVTGPKAFDANEMFEEDTWENKAFSVINELSFAYNTDTAGLNTYLGYSISPYKTSYMPEFEYAAQMVVAKGAGNFAVVPTDYGWHIIYCTFSFADAGEGNAFTFDYDQREVENSFSYNYFESLKSTAVSSYASALQSDVIEVYVDLAKIFEEKFADLRNLG